jgi:hypothetical protein
MRLSAVFSVVLIACALAGAVRIQQVEKPAVLKTAQVGSMARNFARGCIEVDSVGGEWSGTGEYDPNLGRLVTIEVISKKHGVSPIVLRGKPKVLDPLRIGHSYMLTYKLNKWGTQAFVSKVVSIPSCPTKK